MSSAIPILEVKRFPDGRREEYACEAVLRRRDLLVVRFRHLSEREAGGFRIPSGSATYGFFWRRRPYVLYAIRDPEGEALAYRFDVVGEVRLRPGRVEFLDLGLDVWVDPSGRAWLEDEAEVEDMVSRGEISPDQRGLVQRTARYLLRRGRVVAAEAEAALSSALCRNA